MNYGGRKEKHFFPWCILAHTQMMSLILPLRSGVCFSTTETSLTKYLAVANWTLANTMQSTGMKGAWISGFAVLLLRTPSPHVQAWASLPEGKRPHGGVLVACQPLGTLVKPFQSYPAKLPAEPKQASDPSKDSQDSSYQRRSLARDQNDELFVKKWLLFFSTEFWPGLLRSKY